MPSQWSLTLSGPPSPRVPLEAPHAVISRWLDTNHKAQVKSFAIDPPRTHARTTVLGVRLLDDSLEERLRIHARRGARVRLGRHHFTVLGSPACAVRVPWATLGHDSGLRAWEVSFRSPATFRRGSRSSPWPAPGGLLTSLVNRWRALDPATVPNVTAEVMRSLWVSDLDGHSEVLRLRDTIVSGFVGRVRYVSDGSQDYATAISALFSFAQFAGVGSHTAFGLGVVSVKPSWQPTRVGDDHHAA